MHRWCLLFILMSCLRFAAADDFVSSQKGSSNSTTSKTGKGKSSGNATKPVITAEREAAAMAFVKEHHPELADIVNHLKESSPKEFERAMRDLSRASERLSQIRQRDEEAYELELKIWQARSRAQLLNARLQMSDDEDLRKQLRDALTEEYDLRLQILSRDRDRFAERVKSLDQQIDRLTRWRDEGIEGQYQQMTKGARKAPVKGNSPTKKKAAKSEAAK